VSIALVVALAYYAGARLGFLLVFPGSPLSVIWPPNAIVLAALLLVPPRAWWIVLLGVLPAHLIVEWQSGVVPLAVPGLYVTNCGEALLGATIVRRLAGGGPPWLGTLRQVVVYVLGAAIAAPFVASFLDTGVVVVTHWAAPREYWLLWEQRFISAVLTNLTVAPVILLLACGGWRWWQMVPRRRGVEAALLALSILGCSYLAFSPPTVLPRNTPELLYLLAPVLLWAAVRFGVGGISASLLAVALLAAGGADASGLFVARAPAAAVATLQLFLIALGAPAFCLAALVQERERDAAALRASQEQYRAVVETQTELITRYRPDLTLTFVNDATCRFMGRTREELLGAPLDVGLDTEASARVRETVQALLAQPDLGILTIEYETPHQDGTRHWQQWTNRAILGADGRVVELQGIGRDITERKRLEQEREAGRVEAERQAEQLDRVFEQTAEGLAVYDAAGQLVRTNAALRMLLSLDAAASSYARMHLSERGSTYQARDLDGHPLAADQSPVWRALHGEVIRGADAVDMQLRTLDGRDVVISGSAAPLRDREGHLVGAIGVFRDQTERRHLEREREEARAQREQQAEELDRVFEQMAEGVVLYDREGHIVRANAAIRRLLSADEAVPPDSNLPLRGWSLSYLVRTVAGQPLAPDTLPAERALHGEQLSGPDALDLQVRTPSGRELELRASAAPLRDRDGQIIGAVAVYLDQTERNQLEREREAAQASELALREVNERLDTFVAMAAHDLRAPVSVSRMVIDRAQQLLRRPVAEGAPAGGEPQARAVALAAQAVETTKQNLNRLWRLVQQLLDASRVKQGTLVLQRQPVDLVELVRTCMDEQRLLNPTRVMAFDQPDALAAPVVVEADSDRLSQVLSNYLSNAVRYSREDQPIAVTVQVVEPETAEAGGRVVRVAVRDHGSGIAPADQETIWNRFQRARSALEAEGGLGLGLYIARTLIELHGGQVGVESVVGKGATFWFTLPLRSSAT
jgi:PAS domain S-box-containing protein